MRCGGEGDWRYGMRQPNVAPWMIADNVGFQEIYWTCGDKDEHVGEPYLARNALVNPTRYIEYTGVSRQNIWRDGWRGHAGALIQFDFPMTSDQGTVCRLLRYENDKNDSDLGEWPPASFRDAFYWDDNNQIDLVNNASGIDAQDQLRVRLNGTVSGHEFNHGWNISNGHPQFMAIRWQGLNTISVWMKDLWTGDTHKETKTGLSWGSVSFAANCQVNVVPVNRFICTYQAIADYPVSDAILDTLTTDPLAWVLPEIMDEDLVAMINPSGASVPVLRSSGILPPLRAA